MEKFNREHQKEILEILYDSFPNGLDVVDKTKLKRLLEDDDLFVANMLYLEEHGLINSGIKSSLSGFYMNSSATKITAKGIDFIQHDGGLGAILNVQTIKFHRDAVVVLEDLIALSGMNDADKEKAKSKLAELTTESLKTVVQTITTAGLAVLMK